MIYQPHSWAFRAVSIPGAAVVVRTWERIAAHHSDILVTNCADELAEGRSSGVRTPAQIVGLPVDTDHFAPVDEGRRKELRSDLGLTSDHVLVCVGRVSYQKGQDQLVAAWERAPLPNTTLVLVGGGDTSGPARYAPRTWNSSIRAVGKQSDVRPWLWAADLCVVPSRYEGQSVAMAEALACGRPVIMTDVNGGREAIVEPSGEPPGGAIVARGDMSAFLAACRDRLTDPLRLDTESHAARKRAVALFAIDGVMARLEEAYDRALSEPAASWHGRGGPGWAEKGGEW